MKKKLLGSMVLIIILVFIFSNGLLSAADLSYINYLNEKEEFHRYKAIISQINYNNQSVELHFLNGERGRYRLLQDAVVFIDNSSAKIEDFESGDAVIVSLDSNSNIRFIDKQNYDPIINTEIKDLGYSDDISKSGSNFEQTLFFPFTDNMSQDDLQLNITFNYPKFFEPDSKIIIRAEDKNIYLNSIAEIDKKLVSKGIYQSNIKVDLTKFITKGDLFDNIIKISILADLNTPLNRCEEAYSDSLFFTLKNSSKLVSKSKIYHNYNISNYLNFNFDKLNIHLPENFKAGTAESYIKFRLFLERNFGNVEKELFYYSEYKEDKLLNENFKTADIFITENNQLSLDRNFNLSIGSKTIDSFISQIKDLYISDEVDVLEFAETGDKKRKLSFADLGSSSLIFNGIGEIEENISFTSADLGFNPEEINLYINSEYTPPIYIESYEKNNSYLKIYFNDQLIRVHQLDYSGRIDNFHIDLPVYLLEQENNLTFAYSYYPIGRDCAANGQDFEAIISSNSYLDIKGEKVDDVITFNNLLNNYYGKGKVILGEDEKKISLKHAAEALLSFRKLDSQPLNLNVTFLKKNEEIGIDGIYKWGLAVLPNMQNYNIKKNIRIESGEVGLKNNDDTLVFEGNISRPSAVWLLEKLNEKPFSLITSSSINKESLKALNDLTNSTNNITFYRGLNGSLLFSSAGSIEDLVLDKYQIVEINEVNPIVIIYKEYKQQLFIAFMILLLIALYFVYIKLAKKPGEK